jgi:hypothetical protein
VAPGDRDVSAVLLEERTPILDAEPSELLNVELLGMTDDRERAEEMARRENAKWGSLTSRIRAVVREAP